MQRASRRRLFSHRLALAATLVASLSWSFTSCGVTTVAASLQEDREAPELKKTPDSLEDMRAIQKRIVSASERAIQATVAITVGNSQGSGVIVSPDGLVLTAAHVIGGADRRATIRMSDGRRVYGRTLETNHRRDSGMLQLEDPGPWPYAELSTVASLPLGTWCLATGHPQGYEKGRAPVLRVGRVLSLRGDFLQSDCPIYSGDSGGPLFDLDGQVIGIHSRIREEISFNLHVPNSAFQEDWKYLLGTGPVLGIECTDHDNGALITQVFQDGAAQRAGMRIDDVVTRLNGRRVEGMDTLVELIQANEAGRQIEVEVMRAGKKLVLAPVLKSRRDK